MVRTGATVASAAALLVALLAVGAAALSGPGYRWGWWGFRQGFSILRWAATAGVLAGAVSLAAILASRHAGGRNAAALAALVLGLALAGWTGNLARTARRVPAIHDITTDTDGPPQFVAIPALRAATDNPLAYGGTAVAEQQRRAYPDIAPLQLAAPPEAAFSRALDAARRLGWTIVAQDGPGGRIEAFDRTFWYGFIDDVVVRIARAGAGSRVDVRSVSRIGKSDIGANARRIRRFLRALAAAA